jgi:uncharacterized surface protein with fasciclin (FAS1) repeats
MFKQASLLSLALVGSSLAQDNNQTGLLGLISSQSDLSTLGTLLGQVPDFAQSLSNATNVTILAPINSAFEELLSQTQGQNLSSDIIEALLAYHILNGTYLSDNVTETPTFVSTLLNQSFTIDDEAVTNVTTGQNVGLFLNSNEGGNSSVVVLSGDLSTSNVTEADIQQDGFTVHKIDRVLSIPMSVSDTALALGLAAVVGGLEATDLTDTVDELENITIFAPNNEAFSQVGSAFANASVETLQSVLQYHVIAGQVVFSPAIMNGSVATVQGNDLNLTVIDNTIFVNSAKVIVPNVILSNGVLHIIDSVLNPEGMSDPDSLNPSSSASAGFSGSSVSEVPFTSAAPSASSTISIPNIVTSAPAVPTSSGEGGGDGGNGDDTGAAPNVRPAVALGLGGALAAAYMLL